MDYGWFSYTQHRAIGPAYSSEREKPMAACNIHSWCQDDERLFGEGREQELELQWSRKGNEDDYSHQEMPANELYHKRAGFISGPKAIL